MPKTKKKFIDRKNAVTFQLVHRSQRDPLIADDTAPQRVLVPVGETQKNKELSIDDRLKEQHKWGIYYDDDYDYLQHLKETNEITMLVPVPNPKREKEKKETKVIADSKSTSHAKINLPSSVFASEVEEDIGLLNKAAPQGLRLDLDPDVVAAMDDDFDFDNPDNELEDNFMELAMGANADIAEEDEGLPESDESEDDSDQSCRGYASDEQWEDDNNEVGRKSSNRMPTWDDFAQEETKSRFSNYSMSSSVIRRNEGLTMLDDRFEKMFAAYDETELGALDCDEIEGNLPIDHEMLMRAVDEFEHQQKSLKLDKEKEIARLARLQQIDEEDEQQESEEEMVKLIVGDSKPKWDCESILSTYSSLYNRPKIIDEPKRLRKIKISSKTGIPTDALNDGPRLTVKSLARLDAEYAKAGRGDEESVRADSVASALNALSLRPRDETPEEKRERKRLLREYRRERRSEKKANKEAFKEEKKRQEANMMNNRNNVRGSKIV